MKKALLLFLAIILSKMAIAYDTKIDGIYYNLNKTAKTAEVTYYKKGNDNQNAYVGIVTIPSTLSDFGVTYTVTSIGYSAFEYCKDLTSITIPSSVTSIGGYAFYNCICLTSVTIPSSVTSIGSYAFGGCSGLASVTIPGSVISIGHSAFRGCICLKSVTIPSSITSIGNNAFSGCSGLTSITIPSSVTSIGDATFSDCSGLVSIKVASDNKVYDSRSNCNAIIKTTTNELISGCKNTVIPNDVAYIVGYAFSGCSSLTSITIPSSVTGIGDYAFYTCDGLTSITIPNSVTSIRQNAFMSCSSLTSITLGSGVKSIGSRSFSCCSKLTDVYCLADNAPSTESDAFEYSNLNNATLHVPESSISNYRYKTPWSSFKNIVSNTTTYILSISASGNGYVSYNNTTIRNKTTTFTVNEGTNATITLSPDNGYRIKSVTVGSTDVTASVSSNRYTLSNIQGDKTVAVVFEAIPTYLLYISATGSGSASYNSTTIRNKTTTFTVNEGTNATITFSPDNGYRIKSVTVGSTDVTASVANNRYTVSNINNNTLVGIEFEANTTYTPGDVNNDGSVSVTDVGCAINYILEQVPSVFVFDAADMNGDKSVSVTDVGMIINFILSEGASRLEGNMERDGNNILPNLSLMSFSNGYELQLENQDAYIGLQFDIELPKDEAISSLQLACADDNDHYVTYRRLDEEKWRVVCYSPTNSSFAPNDSSLLTFTITGSCCNNDIQDVSQPISISNIRLTTTRFEELRPTTIEGTTTGITSTKQDMQMTVEYGKLYISSDRDTTIRLFSLDCCVYRTLQVKKGVNSFDGLRPGLYMINNKKIILR